MNQPDFTIVATVYQQDTLFWRMLDSVLMQTHPSWELRIYADGPHLELRERLAYALQQEHMQPFASRITFEEHLRFEGCVGNLLRGKGVKAARGRYICWLGHDCLLYPDYLATHWAQCQYGDVLSVVHINHWQVRSEHFRCYGRFPKVPARQAQSSQIDLTCYAMPTATARAVDAFNYDERYLYEADYAVFDRARSRLDVVESERICAAHF